MTRVAYRITLAAMAALCAASLACEAMLQDFVFRVTARPRTCFADLRITGTTTGAPVAGADVEFAQACFAEIAESSIGEFVDAFGEPVGETNDEGEVRAAVLVRPIPERVFGGAFDPTTAGEMWIVRIRAEGLDETVAVIASDPTTPPRDPCGAPYTFFERLTGEGSTLTVSVALPPSPGSSICDDHPGPYTRWWDE